MIIVSQKKKEIVNYYNIVGIEIKNNKILAYGNDCNNNFFYNLGEYKTEQRAKEILKEIIDEYKHSYKVIYNNLSTPTLVPKPIAYEMPEE